MEEIIRVTEDELRAEEEYIARLEDELSDVRDKWSEESDKLTFKRRRLRAYEIYITRLPRLISDLWRLQKWHVKRAEFLKRYVESLKRRLIEAPRLKPLVDYYERLLIMESGEAERLEKSAKRREYDYELAKRTVEELKLAIDEESKIITELYDRMKRIIEEIDYERDRLRRKVVIRYFKIQGRVIDDETEEPIVNAIVKLNGYEVKTGPFGDFLIENVEEGEYTLTIEAVGYEKYETKLFVNRDITLEIRLKRIPKPYDLVEYTKSYRYDYQKVHPELPDKPYRDRWFEARFVATIPRKPPKDGVPNYRWASNLSLAEDIIDEAMRSLMNWVDDVVWEFVREYWEITPYMYLGAEKIGEADEYKEDVEVVVENKATGQTWSAIVTVKEDEWDP